jgi:lysophospholipase L1-like esterase
VAPSSLPRRLLALVAGTALAAGGLAALTASPALAGPGSGPTAIVSLGDSAISGEGAGSYEPGTDFGLNYCHRSANALIKAATIPVQAKINIACSGAKSSDVQIGGTVHYTEPSQADQLRAIAANYDVKMVVLQIGANDDPQFTSSVFECVQAWANPFGPACATNLRPAWPGRVAAMAPKAEKSVNDVKRVMSQAGYAEGSYQFVLQSYASPFTENMSSLLHAFQGCPIRLSDAKFARTEAVAQLSAALRGVAARTGVRFLDLARATEGREACNKSTSSSNWWQNGLKIDADELFQSPDPVNVVRQTFHPNAKGHSQLGRCLTEFYASTADREGFCLRGADGNLHVNAGVTTAVAARS